MYYYCASALGYSLGEPSAEVVYESCSWGGYGVASDDSSVAG